MIRPKIEMKLAFESLHFLLLTGHLTFDFSMRENPPNPGDAVLNLENETKPPNYSDLFSASSGSSLASSPPSYSSKTPSVENNAATNEMHVMTTT